MGYISYYEFIDNVLAQDFIPKQNQQNFAAAVTKTLCFMRHKNATKVGTTV